LSRNLAAEGKNFPTKINGLRPPPPRGSEINRSALRFEKQSCDAFILFYPRRRRQGP
jgi:hypothetical protein